MAKKYTALAPADLWLKDAAYRGLLDDVIEHPDDDTPRLVMADWLEEHGDEVAQDRARFIRLQLERAKLSEHHPRAWQLRGQEKALLRRHHPAWLGRLEKMISNAMFHRGFPDEIVLGVSMLAKNADALFSLTPVRQLQVLRIAQMKLTLSDLAAIAGLKRLRALRLRNSALGDTVLRDFLTTVKLPHLEELDLSGCGVGARTMDALKENHLPRLKSLVLVGNTFFGQFDLLARGLADYTLESLDLSDIALGRPDIEALSQWEGLSSIRRLALNGISIGAGGCGLLLGSLHLGELERLELANASVRINGAAAIARCAKLTKLRHLNLSYSMIDHTGLNHLLDSPHLHNLESFDFSTFGLQLSHLKKLWSWPGLPGIRHLGMKFVNLGNEGLRRLLAAPKLGEITSLDLENTGLTAGAAELFASCDKLRSLASLDINGGLVTDTDLKTFLDAPNLAGLQRLNLTAARITPETAALYQARFPKED